ncbi:MAG: helix-turn-helix domain-containing protein [Burkholderiaceae bacterium]|nr:helix-turn-helix domain-containing protein [Burkholderiaceae bacterium]
MTKRKALVRILHSMPGNSARTQQQRIVLALRQLGTVTTSELVRWLDVPRPGARVCELRKLGPPIATHWRTDTTEAGKPHRFALYTLN